MGSKYEEISNILDNSVKFANNRLCGSLGGSYNIDFADKDLVQVNYDSSVVNYPHMLAQVASHCAAYGKGYENDSTITNGWGITMAIYRCRGEIEPDVMPRKIIVK
ncbi:hypothetical protein [Agarivorans sp. Z349TD_8]|uniref:hypothetical protein n=1 Tax=Agarivorans sp. Z349TD_8 TaxID=3421434 RepID=UPI003D7EA4C4